MEEAYAFHDAIKEAAALTALSSPQQHLLDSPSIRFSPARSDSDDSPAGTPADWVRSAPDSPSPHRRDHAVETRYLRRVIGGAFAKMQEDLGHMAPRSYDARDPDIERDPDVEAQPAAPEPEPPTRARLQFDEAPTGAPVRPEGSLLFTDLKQEDSTDHPFGTLDGDRRAS